MSKSHDKHLVVRVTRSLRNRVASMDTNPSTSTKTELETIGENDIKKEKISPNNTPVKARKNSLSEAGLTPSSRKLTRRASLSAEIENSPVSSPRRRSTRKLSGLLEENTQTTKTTTRIKSPLSIDPVSDEADISNKRSTRSSSKSPSAKAIRSTTRNKSPIIDPILEEENNEENEVPIKRITRSASKSPTEIEKLSQNKNLRKTRKDVAVKSDSNKRGLKRTKSENTLDDEAVVIEENAKDIEKDKNGDDFKDSPKPGGNTNENEKSVDMNKDILKNSNVNENNGIEETKIEKPLQHKMKLMERRLTASCCKDAKIVELKDVNDIEENKENNQSSNESQQETILLSSSVEVVQKNIEPTNEKANVIEVLETKEMENLRNKNISNEKPIDIVSTVTLEITESKEKAAKLNSELLNSENVHESNPEQKSTEGEEGESMAEQLETNEMNKSSDEKKTDYGIQGKELQQQLTSLTIEEMETTAKVSAENEKESSTNDKDKKLESSEDMKELKTKKTKEIEDLASNNKNMEDDIAVLENNKNENVSVIISSRSTAEEISLRKTNEIEVNPESDISIEMVGKQSSEITIGDKSISPLNEDSTSSAKCNTDNVSESFNEIEIVAKDFTKKSQENENSSKMNISVKTMEKNQDSFKEKSVTFDSNDIENKTPSKYPKTPIFSKSKSRIDRDTVANNSELKDLQNNSEMGNCVNERNKSSDDKFSLYNTPVQSVHPLSISSSTPIEFIKSKKENHEKFLEEINSEKKNSSLKDKQTNENENTFSKSWSHAIVGTVDSSKNSKAFIDAIELNKDPEEVIKTAEVNSSDESEDEDDDDNEENERQKNDFINDEAEIDEKYESHDSMDTEEREYLENNEIPHDGESIGSEDTEELNSGEDENESLDSFIVLSEDGEENNESDTSEESEYFSSDDDESDVVSNEGKKLKNSSKSTKRIVSSDEENQDCNNGKQKNVLRRGLAVESSSDESENVQNITNQENESTSDKVACTEKIPDDHNEKEQGINPEMEEESKKHNEDIIANEAKQINEHHTDEDDIMKKNLDTTQVVENAQLNSSQGNTIFNSENTGEKVSYNNDNISRSRTEDLEFGESEHNDSINNSAKVKNSSQLTENTLKESNVTEIIEENGNNSVKEYNIEENSQENNQENILGGKTRELLRKFQSSSSTKKKRKSQQLPTEDALEADITNERQTLHKQGLFITANSGSNINEVENDNEKLELRVSSPSSVEDDKILKNIQNKKNRSKLISSIHSNISFADQNEDTTIQQMSTSKKNRKVKKDNLSVSLMPVGKLLDKEKKEKRMSLSSGFTYNLPSVSNSKNFEDESQSSKSVDINEVEDENKNECSDNSSIEGSKKISLNETFTAESNSEDDLSTNDNIKELHENCSKEIQEIEVNKTIFTKKSEKTEATNIEDECSEIPLDVETKEIEKSVKKSKSFISEGIMVLNEENISSCEKSFEKENKIIQKNESAKRKKSETSEKMKNSISVDQVLERCDQFLQTANEAKMKSKKENVNIKVKKSKEKKHKKKQDLNSLESEKLKAKQVLKAVKYGEFLLEKQKKKFIQAKKKDAFRADEIIKETDDADAYVDNEHSNIPKSEEYQLFEENIEPKCITSKKKKNKPQKSESKERKRQTSESNKSLIKTPFGIFYEEPISPKSNTENKFNLEKKQLKKRKRLLQDESASDRNETYNQNKKFIKTSAGIFCEEAISPIPNEKKKLKMTTILELPIGTVLEQPITPKSNTKNGFKESDATPRSLGFKVESILSAGQKNVAVEKKKKPLKRKLMLDEPTTVLPKPKWIAKTEKYSVTKIRVGEGGFVPLDLDESVGTEFSVAPLKSKKKCSKVYGLDPNIAAGSFKDRASFNAKIKRGTSKELLQRKQKQLANSKF